MTAAETLQAAQEAGLVVTVEAKTLAIRGPEQARSLWLPQVAQHGREIRKIVLAGGLRAMPRCQVVPDAPCPACGWIHGTLENVAPCASCGAQDAIVSVISMAGDRLCGACFRDR